MGAFPIKIKYSVENKNVENKIWNFVDWNVFINILIKILKISYRLGKRTHVSSTRLYTVLYTGTLLLRFLRHYCVCIHPLFIRALRPLLCTYVMHRINCLKTKKLCFAYGMTTTTSTQLWYQFLTCVVRNVDRASVPRTVPMCLFANIVFRKET